MDMLIDCGFCIRMSILTIDWTVTNYVEKKNKIKIACMKLYDRACITNYVFDDTHLC